MTYKITLLIETELTRQQMLDYCERLADRIKQDTDKTSSVEDYDVEIQSK